MWLCSIFLNLPLCPPPPLETLPVLITWYDPGQCYNEAGQVIANVNCDSDPGSFADATAVLPESYGATAACIAEWLGGTVVISGVGAFRCRDTGAAVQVVWNKAHEQWVIHVDLLLREAPVYNYWLFEEWELQWDR